MIEITDELLQSIKEINLKTLQESIKSGTSFVPKVHVFGEDQAYVLFTPFSDDEEKKEVFLQVGAFAFDKKAHQVIFVCDTLMKQYTDPKYAQENWDTESPSTYPSDQRTDALLLYVLDFKDSSKELLTMLPYKVDESKCLQMLTLEKDSVGSTNGFIRSKISEGFMRAKLIDLLKRKEIIPESLLKMDSSVLLTLMNEIKSEIDSEYPNLLVGVLKKD